MATRQIIKLFNAFPTTHQLRLHVWDYHEREAYGTIYGLSVGNRWKQLDTGLLSTQHVHTRGLARCLSKCGILRESTHKFVTALFVQTFEAIGI